MSVHIDSLVIDGVPMRPGQGAQLQHAIESELARLLEGGSLRALGSGGAVPEVPAPTISLGATWRPAGLGRQIARSIAASLDKLR